MVIATGRLLMQYLAHGLARACALRRGSPADTGHMLLKARQTPTATGDERGGRAVAKQPTHEVEELIYELLDAHDDTGRLASSLVVDEAWAAHLDYLQSLQRVGRELLADWSASVAEVAHRPDQRRQVNTLPPGLSSVTDTPASV